LYRYTKRLDLVNELTKEKGSLQTKVRQLSEAVKGAAEVGLCTLNSFDP
jgi:hypothetical protein